MSRSIASAASSFAGYLLLLILIVMTAAGPGNSTTVSVAGDLCEHSDPGLEGSSADGEEGESEDDVLERALCSAPETVSAAGDGRYPPFEGALEDLLADGGLLRPPRHRA